MESETTLVGTKSRVELDTVTTVKFEITLVVFPDNTELDDTLGDLNDFQAASQVRVDLEELRVLKAGNKFADSLLEFGFVRKVRHFEKKEDGDFG
jgi:hypothetical protein